MVSVSTVLCILATLWTQIPKNPVPAPMSMQSLSRVVFVAFFFFFFFSNTVFLKYSANANADSHTIPPQLFSSSCFCSTCIILALDDDDDVVVVVVVVVVVLDFSG